MRRKAFAWLLVLLLLPIFDVSSEGYLAMTVVPSRVAPGGSLHIYFTVPEEGTVHLTVQDEAGAVCATLLSDANVASGANDLVWDGRDNGKALAPGPYVLRLTMKDMEMEMDVTLLAQGDSTAAQTVPPQPLPSEAPMTPSFRSDYVPRPVHEACYWCTPMDIRNEAAVWAMLMAPVTVLKGNGPKDQVILREEPSEDARGVGVVTCLSQSVHVLETRKDGWSLVECYSSSFHDSRVKAWNLFVTGYVRTNKLAQKKPAQEYGVVVDKLTQELYLFQEGRLFSRLLVSTGLYNDEQPYNETRSGEFLIVSRTGDIRSDNLIGSYALRFNSGDLIHEVPHVKNADGTKNFQYVEHKLGTRASHGCIRTQRLKNAEGINMGWLWNHLSLYSKIVVWEDYAGRAMEIPPPSTPLYYNTDNGASYHATPNCNGVRKEYLPLTGIFTYEALEDPEYQRLEMCQSCIPPRRIAEIEEINRIHQTQSPGEIPQHLRQEK